MLIHPENFISCLDIDRGEGISTKAMIIFEFCTSYILLNSSMTWARKKANSVFNISKSYHPKLC